MYTQATCKRKSLSISHLLEYLQGIRLVTLPIRFKFTPWSCGGWPIEQSQNGFRIRIFWLVGQPQIQDGNFKMMMGDVTILIPCKGSSYKISRHKLYLTFKQKSLSFSHFLKILKSSHKFNTWEILIIGNKRNENRIEETIIWSVTIQCYSFKIVPFLFYFHSSGHKSVQSRSGSKVQ